VSIDCPTEEQLIKAWELPLVGFFYSLFSCKKFERGTTMKKYLLIAIAGFLLTTVSTPTNAEINIQAVAIETAENFFELIEHGELEQAFNSTTDIHKDHKVKDAWINSSLIQKKYYGSLINRAIKTVTSKNTIPDHPDGTYLTVIYETTFQNKEKAYERIDLMLVSENLWKVTEYFYN